MILTDIEQKELAEKISEAYFRQNFGSMSKADFELLLFSEYLSHCMNAKEKVDDYTLSKSLGITQTRVRALKERKELKYPDHSFEWRDDFVESVKNAKYDKNDHYVKMIIQDVRVMNEVRHFIEEKGWYDECSLNKKLLRIPLACFTDICIDDSSIHELFTSEAKKKVKSISKSDSEIEKFLTDFTKEGFKTFLMRAGKEAILSVISFLPFGGVAKEAFNFIGKTIERA